VTPAELEREIIVLNGKYSKIPFDDWHSQARALAYKALDMYRFEPEYTDDMISLIARSIVFWGEDEQLATMQDMWIEAIASDNIEFQGRLGSIIEVVSISYPKDTMRDHLPGIDQIDRTRQYGVGLATVIRRYGDL
jgi:hypothetical protein